MYPNLLKYDIDMTQFYQVTNIHSLIIKIICYSTDCALKFFLQELST